MLTTDNEGRDNINSLTDKLTKELQFSSNLREELDKNKIHLTTMETLLSSHHEKSSYDKEQLREALATDRVMSERLQAEAWEAATEALEESLKAERKLSGASLARCKRLESEKAALKSSNQDLELERSELLEALGEERLLGEDRAEAISGLSRAMKSAVGEMEGVEGDEETAWKPPGDEYQLAVANLPRFIQRSILFTLLGSLRDDRLATRLANWRRIAVEDALHRLHDSLTEGREVLQTLQETHEVDVFFDLEAEEKALASTPPVATLQAPPVVESFNALVRSCVFVLILSCQTPGEKQSALDGGIGKRPLGQFQAGR